MNPYSDLLRKCKIVFLGDSGAGKSTLISAIETNSFQPNLRANVGTALKTIIRPSKRSDEMLEFLIWDTAGQEIYKSITANYVRKADYAVICFDPGTEYKTQIQNWTKFLRDKEEKTKICLVATKSDLYKNDENFFTSLAKKIDKYTDKIMFSHVSSLTGENVQSLFQTIVEDFDSTDDINHCISENKQVSLTNSQNQSCFFPKQICVV